MRTLFLFLSATILFTQCEVKKNVSCGIRISEEAEVPQKLETEQEMEKELELKFSFITVEEFEYDIDGKKGSIILEKLKDWNDPGDYHRIRIIGDTSYSFFNVDGWIKIEAYQVPDSSYLYINNKLNSEYIILDESNEHRLLYAFGYPYASEPGLLTVFNLNENGRVNLIFNDNYDIHEYQMNNVCPLIIVGDYDYDGKKRLDTIIFRDNRFYKPKIELEINLDTMLISQDSIIEDVVATLGTNTINCDSCNIDLVAKIYDDVEGATDMQLLFFLCSMREGCSNNAEFSEFSNEVLYLLLLSEKRVGDVIRIINDNTTLLSMDFLKTEIEHPIHDGFDMKKAYNNAKRIKNYEETTKIILEAISTAIKNMGGSL